VAADDPRLEDALTELFEQDGYAVERKPCPDEGADLTLLRDGVRMAVQAEAAAPPDPKQPQRGRTA
jgi:HJR/Mrr/RecB family endonuclease